MAAGGNPTTSERGGRLEVPLGRPLLCADGETETGRGQGLSQETVAPELSASGLFQLL